MGKIIIHDQYHKFSSKNMLHIILLKDQKKFPEGELLNIVPEVTLCITE